MIIKENQILEIQGNLYKITSVKDKVYSIEEIDVKIVENSPELTIINNRLNEIEKTLSNILELSKSIRNRQIAIEKGYM